MKKTVAQGTFYLTISQAFALICGYALHITLGRVLGPSHYGLFGFVISLLVWLEITLGGVSGAAIKKVAESPFFTKVIEKKAIYLQSLVAIILFVLAFSFSPFLSRIFNDPKIDVYFKIAILDIPILAFYNIYIALLNGSRFYKQQAIASIVYFFSKLIFVVGLVLLGLSVAGALIGNIMASVFGFLVGFYYFRELIGGTEEVDINDTVKTVKSFGLLKLAVPFAIVGLLFNLLMSIDLWFVKEIVLSAPKVGYYVAASTLAKVLYFLFGALSSALFPAITNSIAEGRIEQTKRYINQALRFLLLFLVPISFVMAVTSTNLVSLLYSQRYLAAGSPLAILAFGYAFISILLAILSILMANNNFKEVIILASFLVLADAGLCMSLISHYGLSGAAMATTLTCLVGVILGASLLWKNFATLVSPQSVFKILISSLVISFIFIMVPATGLNLTILYVVAALAYMGLLVLFKEIKSEDILILKGLIEKS
ncbi:MAG: oligosaccharide flippase family protein [Actinomycetota bacterium]|nr:oligosaccharide flippase family protein [Actinomycetota bacterium]